MEPLRWNEAKPKDHRTKHENQACLVADKGLDVANYSRASGGGRKMFLTSPLIDQAISLKTPGQAAGPSLPGWTRSFTGCPVPLGRSVLTTDGLALGGGGIAGQEIRSAGKLANRESAT